MLKKSKLPTRIIQPGCCQRGRYGGLSPVEGVGENGEAIVAEGKAFPPFPFNLVKVPHTRPEQVLA